MGYGGIRCCWSGAAGWLELGKLSELQAMDTRRDFLKKAALFSGAAAMGNMLPPVIQKALAIDPVPGSTFHDAEHIVFLMQENRSFDHIFGSLRGVRGFNDPRAIRLANDNRVWLQSNKDGDTFVPFRLDVQHTHAAWMERPDRCPQ
jgi:phospholipase C